MAGGPYFYSNQRNYWVCLDKVLTKIAMDQLGIKTTPIHLGKMRVAMLREKGNGSNGAADSPSAELSRHLDVMLKAIKSVGGMEQARSAISIIERARSL